MKINKIFIRADANKVIGTGHIMRCLSIANKLVRIGTEVIFIVADEESSVLVQEKGFKYICLNTQWDNLDSEIEKIKGIILENSIQRLLIDDYYVTKKYLQEIGKLTEITYLDDINHFIYPVSHVVNYNIYAEDLEYKKRYSEHGLKTGFFLGTKYAPLRDEFESLPCRKFKGLRSVLVTSGGTDNYNMIGNVIEHFAKEDSFSSYEFYCVVGRFNAYKAVLMEKNNKYPNVHMLYNISNMDYYMKICDLCITAGGTTIYELCACGLPSILYTLADNQLDCARKVSELNLIPWVGDIRTDMQSCLDNVLLEVEKFKNLVYWESISHRMQNYVDGKGAQRIADELIKCAE